jgi:hypothetical protein
MPSSNAWYDLTHLYKVSLQALEDDSESTAPYIVPLPGVNDKKNDKKYVVWQQPAGEG